MAMILISMSASMLWSSVNLDLLISGNSRRSAQAKIAAHSGINHFIALQENYENLVDGIVIPMTRLSSKTFYKVEVDITCCRPDMYIVKSTGYYRKGDRDIATYPVRATFSLK